MTVRPCVSCGHGLPESLRQKRLSNAPDDDRRLRATSTQSIVGVIATETCRLISATERSAFLPDTKQLPDEDLSGYRALLSHDELKSDPERTLHSSPPRIRSSERWGYRRTGGKCRPCSLALPSLRAASPSVCHRAVQQQLPDVLTATEGQGRCRGTDGAKS